MLEYMIYYPVQSVTVVGVGGLIYLFAVWRLEKWLDEEKKKDIKQAKMSPYVPMDIAPGEYAEMIPERFNDTEALQRDLAPEWDNVAFEDKRPSERLYEGLVS